MSAKKLIYEKIRGAKRADIKFQENKGRGSRRMPGHIREFNRLESHSSHDLVFKIWRNNKTEATLGVFCL